MTKKESLEKLSKLLGSYHFWYEVEELETYCNANYPIELVDKAYGDSYEVYIEDAFEKADFKKLKELSSELNIKLPEAVWYD